MIRLSGLVFFLAISFSTYSQQVYLENPPVRKSTNYIGLQVNELLKQLFNLSGNSTPVNNNYLFTYAVNSNRTGVGLNVGFGYSYSQVNTGDAVTPRQTTTYSFAFRTGIEKKFTIGKKWLSSYGMDIIVDDNGTKTETTISPPGAPVQKTTTETTTSGFGLGPRFTINFFLSDQIILGTEASYYYKSLSTTQKATGVQDISNPSKSFTLVVPAVLYLVMKF